MKQAKFADTEQDALRFAKLKASSFNHDDLCMVPGCGRKGSWKYPIHGKEQKLLGFLCIVHGWQSLSFADKDQMKLFTQAEPARSG